MGNQDLLTDLIEMEIKLFVTVRAHGLHGNTCYNNKNNNNNNSSYYYSESNGIFTTCDITFLMRATSNVI